MPASPTPGRQQLRRQRSAVRVHAGHDFVQELGDYMLHQRTRPSTAPKHRVPPRQSAASDAQTDHQAVLSAATLPSQLAAHHSGSPACLPFAATGRTLSQAQLRVAELGLQDEAETAMHSRMQLPQQPLRATRSSTRFFQSHLRVSEQHKPHTLCATRPMVVRIETTRRSDAVPPASCCACSSAEESIPPPHRNLLPSAAWLLADLPVQGNRPQVRTAAGYGEVSKIGGGMRGSMKRSQSHPVLKNDPKQDAEVLRLSSQAAVSEWVRHRVLHGSYNSAVWDQSRRVQALQPQRHNGASLGTDAASHAWLRQGRSPCGVAIYPAQ